MGGGWALIGLTNDITDSYVEVLQEFEDTVNRLVLSGWSHHDISSSFQNIFPGVRGLSERNIRRFCSTNQIHYRSGLNPSQLERLVANAIRRAGNSYGRRTLQGFLRSHGSIVSQDRIRLAMQQVAPGPMSIRRRISNQATNPHPYHANYFGDKIHFDQNEKLNMYGVVHVIAVDGYSRKICGLISIPRKNPILIYDKLMRPLLLSHGSFYGSKSEWITGLNLHY